MFRMNILKQFSAHKINPLIQKFVSQSNPARQNFFQFQHKHFSQDHSSEEAQGNKIYKILVNFKTSRKIQTGIFYLFKWGFYGCCLLTFLNLYLYLKSHRSDESYIYNKYAYGFIRLLHYSARGALNVRRVSY
jgi:hypothetical protein